MVDSRQPERVSEESEAALCGRISLAPVVSGTIQLCGNSCSVIEMEDIQGRLPKQGVLVIASGFVDTKYAWYEAINFHTCFGYNGNPNIDINTSNRVTNRQPDGSTVPCAMMYRVSIWVYCQRTTSPSMHREVCNSMYLLGYIRV